VISVDSIGLITSHYKDLSGLNTYNPPESIKKITRINLEEKTFEEI
jgi:hypothetical protein